MLDNIILYISIVIMITLIIIISIGSAIRFVIRRYIRGAMQENLISNESSNHTCGFYVIEATRAKHAADIAHHRYEAAVNAHESNLQTLRSVALTPQKRDAAKHAAMISDTAVCQKYRLSTAAQSWADEAISLATTPECMDNDKTIRATYNHAYAPSVASAIKLLLSRTR